MEGVLHEQEHPKKRRKREHQRRPLSANLVLDSSLREDVGLLSEDLWLKLDTLGVGDQGMVLIALRRK